MKLSESLKWFVDVFGRNNTDIGVVKYSNKEGIGKNDLDSFYNILVFDKVLTIGGEMSLDIQPLSQLEKAQEGWGKILKGNTLIEDILNWNKNWIVFSSRNDNAIFYDKEDGRILGSVDKKVFYELGINLSTYFDILTECMILERDKYNFETFDEEEEETLPEFIEDVSNILLTKTTKAKADEFLKFFFG